MVGWVSKIFSENDTIQYFGGTRRRVGDPERRRFALRMNRV
ncbi:MAG: hypothetical protein AAF192_13095 [Pseudomonadota bacterium]